MNIDNVIPWMDIFKGELYSDWQRAFIGIGLIIIALIISKHLCDYLDEKIEDNKLRVDGK